MHAASHATLPTTLLTQRIVCAQIQREVDKRVLADLQQQMAQITARAASAAGSGGDSPTPADTTATPQHTHKPCTVRLEPPPSGGAPAAVAAAGMLPLSPPAALLRGASPSTVDSDGVPVAEAIAPRLAALASTGTVSHCQQSRYILAYTP